MKPVAIVQARMSSSRLPGKVLKPICDDTVLGYIIDRCLQSKKLNGVMVATSDLVVDDPVAEFSASRGIPVFRGSEDDVLSRYVKAAKWKDVDVVVRITGDCPLIAPEVIDKAVALYEAESPDYAYIQGYPQGLGAAEVLSVAVLKRAWEETEQEYDCEHVMPYLLKNPEQFKLAIKQVEPPCYRPDLRVCVDEPADLKVVRRICEHFYPRKDFGAYEVIQFLDNNPNVAQINKNVEQKTN